MRAINTEGTLSPQDATVAFIVLAPVWQRWWFLAAAALPLGILIYVLYRYRLAQLLAVERISHADSLRFARRHRFQSFSDRDSERGPQS